MWIISLQTTQAVASIVWEVLESFSDSVALFEDKSDQTQWHIHALTPLKPLSEELQTVITTICEQHKTAPPIIHIEELPEKDWVAENQSSFSPLTVGSFYVHDAHHLEDLPSEKICLQIDASTAFGTGHHGTTQGCLEALEFLHKGGLRLEKIIDIGTGTGILAIAAAKLFGIPVVASDIDPEALIKAKENILLNRCHSCVTLIQADGFNHPDLLAHQPFDLVIANILANTLIELTPSIAQATQKGSTLILSGLLTDQEESVKQAFALHQFALQKKIVHQEWMTLILSS